MFFNGCLPDAENFFEDGRRLTPSFLTEGATRLSTPCLTLNYVPTNTRHTYGQTYVCTHTHTHACTQARTHTHTHALIHAHTHTPCFLSPAIPAWLLLLDDSLPRPTEPDPPPMGGDRALVPTTTLLGTRSSSSNMGEGGNWPLLPWRLDGGGATNPSSEMACSLPVPLPCCLQSLISI